MGTAAERIDREIAVLRAELGYDPSRVDGDVRDYIDALEELARDAAEGHERRSADVEASSSSVGVGARRRDGLQPGSQRYRIAKHLSSLGLLSDEGQITDEISRETGIPLNSVSTRMSELLRDGWVVEQGEGAGGKTRYAATPKTREHFERLTADEAERAKASPW